MEMEFRLAKKQDMEHIQLQPRILIINIWNVMETVRKQIIFIL